MKQQESMVDSLPDGEDGTAAGSETEKHLTFYIDNQLFAIPSDQVVDIISLERITYMPKLPPYVKGVINIRGKIVPLIDLRVRFGREAKPYDERTCIVVTEAGEYSVGFIVDRVNDVTDVSKERIMPAPRMSDNYADYIAGVAQVESGVALFLDIIRILEDESEEKAEA